MALLKVAQAVLLANVFTELLEAYTPRFVAVLGCAGGNGFERISPKITTRVVGIDINSAYIGSCGAHFDSRIPGLELLVGDIGNDTFYFASVKSGYAALLLEYVDVRSALKRIRSMLAPGGILATAVQLPSLSASIVRPSAFARVQALCQVMHLVSPPVLQNL